MASDDSGSEQSEQMQTIWQIQLNKLKKKKINSQMIANAGSVYRNIRHT